MSAVQSALALGLVALLCACVSETADPSRVQPRQQVAVVPPPPPPPSVAGPLLDASGVCTGPAPTSATTIEKGIGECELVRLKGEKPTDVLIGEGRAGREVQVLYNELGSKELYFFVNGKLDRMLR